MKNKKTVVALTAILTVLVFIGVFLMIWFVGDTYKDFKNNFRKEFEIEGLKDGAVPQGMTAYTAGYKETDSDGKTTDKTQQYFLISAYMKDGSASRIYVTGASTGYVGYVTLKNSDGSDFTGHCGGIATNGYTLWITGESVVNVAKASEAYNKVKKNIPQEIVEKAGGLTLEGEETNNVITFTSSFKANNRASFCYYFDDPTYTTVSNDRLYVGEFYRPVNYKTSENHKLTTPNGYKNNAFMYEYNVTSNTENKYGLITLSDDNLTDENKVPKIQKIFSIPEKIQGAAFSGRTSYNSTTCTLVLSQSYGLANSHLLCYDYSKITANTNRVKYNELHKDGSGKAENAEDRRFSFEYDGVVKTVGSQSIPYTDDSLYVYYVDNGNGEMLINDYSIPSMSEGMCVVTPNTSSNAASTRVYVLFESASKKYRAFVREPLKNVYSFIPHNK